MESEEAPPALPSTTTATTKRHARYPAKTCKYAGVTFRSSRDKYQARIYKGNKEYNLGLFEVAADAALAYDTAHRLVKKITSVTGGMGKEKETLAEYEADKESPDWLDCDDEAAQAANNGLDPDKLNFIKPQDYKDERARELEESKDSGTQKHKNAPSISTVQMTVRKESIRVVKIIVGASDGGTNNYRARKGTRKPAKDGAMLMGSKRRKKGPNANQESMNAMLAHGNGMGMMPYGMGMPGMPNYPMMMNGFVPPHMAAMNQEMMMRQAMMYNPMMNNQGVASPTKQEDGEKGEEGKDGDVKKEEGNDTNGSDFNSQMLSSDRYREFFMRSGMAGVQGGPMPQGMYGGGMPDDLNFQRMMMARAAMGQNPGMQNNGMEGPQTPEELEKKLKELENLKSQAGNNDSSSNGGGQQNMPYGYGFPGNNGTPGANNGGGGWNC